MRQVVNFYRVGKRLLFLSRAKEWRHRGDMGPPKKGRTFPQDRAVRERECCHTWLCVIEQSTAILRPVGHGGAERVSISVLDNVTNYLEILEGVLNKLEAYWDKPPLKMPPKFRQNGMAMEIPPAPQSSARVLSIRRIQIRVVTAQSEVHAQKASQYRFTKPVPEWSLGSQTYAQSLERIHMALRLADSECARLLIQQEEEEETGTADESAGYSHQQQRHRQRLSGNEMVEDAQIVEVAVRYLTDERDKYRKAAESQAARLRRKLAPQWTSRDEVRARIGDDRWRNNPAPKNDYSKMRREDERQLKDIERALDQLNAMEVPGSVGDRYKNQKSPQSQRYNGQRPTDLSRRVPIELYPDPTLWGWIFTGSWNNYVEFFEKDGVKLDWYFTTGTVKTSMDHPQKGKTQLFGAKVKPEVYGEVMFDPRAHTNVRYHKKENRPKANS